MTEMFTSHSDQYFMVKGSRTGPKLKLLLHLTSHFFLQRNKVYIFTSSCNKPMIFGVSNAMLDCLSSGKH